MTTTALAESVQIAANAAWAAGISVIPIKADGSKGPVFAWKPYQSTRPTAE